MIIKLEKFTDNHIKKTFTWISNPGLRRQFLIRGEEPAWDEHVAYFQRVLNDPQQRFYAILADKVHVGNCGIKEIQWSDKRGELWIYIGELDYQGKGIGKEAFALLLDEAVEMLKLKFFCVHVADINIAAKKLYKKFNFKETDMSSEELEIWANRGEQVIRMEAGAKK